MQKPKLSRSTTGHLTNPPLADFAYFASLLCFPHFLSSLFLFCSPSHPFLLCFFLFWSFSTQFFSFHSVHFLIPLLMSFLPFICFITSRIPAVPSFFSLSFPCFFIFHFAFFTHAESLPSLVLACCLYFCSSADFTFARLLHLLLFPCLGFVCGGLR